MSALERDGFRAVWFAVCMIAAMLPYVGVVEANSTVAVVDVPAAGKFLVARRGLPDPRFRRTVILLLHHDRGGSAGLIINRRTSAAPSHLDPDLDGIGDPGQRLFYGGPVATAGLTFLVRSKSRPEDARAVITEVFLGTQKKRAEALLRMGKTMDELRLYFGHAGWAPGQLDGELARGDWYVVDADADAVFTDEGEQLWQHYIDRHAPPGLMAARTRTNG